MKFIHKSSSFLLFICLANILGLATPSSAQYGVIKVNEIEMYSLPMVDDIPVAVLSKVDTIRVIGKRGDWVKVAAMDGRKGWMQMKTTPNTVSTRNKRKDVVLQPSRKLERKEANFSKPVVKSKPEPDLIQKNRDTNFMLAPTMYRRFGYSFGMGLIELDYTYNWKFVFHSTRRLALEGSFRHVLGNAADSYFIMANLSYLLKQNTKLLPYITGGMGVINTVPDRGISTESVSNMAINYGFGFRKYFKNKLSLILGLTQYTAFVGNGMRHFREVTAGVLVGKFWD